jgi:long-subunit acyl-CoA synthetase (AMP-forming)
LALGQFLKGAGLTEGDRVLIFAENRPEWHIAGFRDSFRGHDRGAGVRDPGRSARQALSVLPLSHAFERLLCYGYFRLVYRSLTAVHTPRRMYSQEEAHLWSMIDTGTQWNYRR